MVKINMLNAASKIEVMVGKADSPRYIAYRPIDPLCSMEHELEKLLVIKFIAKQYEYQATNEKCIQFFNEAVAGWDRYMEDVAALANQRTRTRNRK